jgi:hypothetical protein
MDTGRYYVEKAATLQKEMAFANVPMGFFAPAAHPYYSREKKLPPSFFSCPVGTFVRRLYIKPFMSVRRPVTGFGEGQLSTFNQDLSAVVRSRIDA